VEYRPAGAQGWASAFLSEPAYDAGTSTWRCLFSPPAEAPAGAYEFRARLNDRDGDRGDWFSPSNAVEVRNNLPAARVAAPPPGVNENVSVVFDGTASSDLEGPLDYEWDFGDGSRAEGESVTHAYTAGGPKNVTLTVTDLDGAQARASVHLRINLLPGALFLFRQSPGVHDYRVSFNGTGSYDAEGALSYAWDFNTLKDTSGDGIPDNDIDSSEPMPSFDYRRAGTFNVKLTVADSDNASATMSLPVRVRQVDPDTSWMAYLAVVAVVAVAAAGVAALARRGRKGPPEAQPAGENNAP
jgi:PKD repeat protein